MDAEPCDELAGNLFDFEWPVDDSRYAIPMPLARALVLPFVSEGWPSPDDLKTTLTTSGRQYPGDTLAALELIVGAIEERAYLQIEPVAQGMLPVPRESIDVGDVANIDLVAKVDALVLDPTGGRFIPLDAALSVIVDEASVKGTLEGGGVLSGSGKAPTVCAYSGSYSTHVVIRMAGRARTVAGEAPMLLICTLEGKRLVLSSARVIAN